MVSTVQKIGFLGTPDFAVPFLHGLVAANFKPVVVITQPDKPVGRQQQMTFPPIKMPALLEHIPVAQPKTKQELKTILEKVQPDICILVAYGMIIPPAILGIPRHGFINIHPSLLPRYRGSSPVQQAILNGDEYTGITIIKLDEQLDHGPIIAQERLPILPTDTNASLHDRLAVFGADVLVGVLPRYLAGTITTRPQDDAQASFTGRVTRGDGRIDWHKSAAAVDRQFRAFCPWPGVYAQWGQKRLKIVNLGVLEGNFSGIGQPGTVFLGPQNVVAVVCASGAIKLERVQLEAKKEMSAADLVRGYQTIIGSVLS